MTENITLENLDNTTGNAKKHWETPRMTVVDISELTEAMLQAGSDGSGANSAS